MFRFLIALINFRLVLIIVLLNLMFIYIANNFLSFHMKGNNGGIIFVLLAMNLLMAEKKMQNNITWALPLKRIQLWLIFNLRIFIISLIVIAADIVINIMAKKPYIVESELVVYGVVILMTTIIYSYRALQTVISPRKRFGFIYPVLIVSIVVVLTIITIALPNIFLDSFEFSRMFSIILISINVVYSFAISYYATMKTKSLLFFRAG